MTGITVADILGLTNLYMFYFLHCHCEQVLESWTLLSDVLKVYRRVVFLCFGQRANMSNPLTVPGSAAQWPFLTEDKERQGGRELACMSIFHSSLLFTPVTPSLSLPTSVTLCHCPSVSFLNAPHVICFHSPLPDGRMIRSDV